MRVVSMTNLCEKPNWGRNLHRLAYLTEAKLVLHSSHCALN
jgi:hypothetical protein